MIRHDGTIDGAPMTLEIDAPRAEAGVWAVTIRMSWPKPTSNTFWAPGANDAARLARAWSATQLAVLGARDADGEPLAAKLLDPPEPFTPAHEGVVCSLAARDDDLVLRLDDVTATRDGWRHVRLFTERRTSLEELRSLPTRLCEDVGLNVLARVMAHHRT